MNKRALNYRSTTPTSVSLTLGSVSYSQSKRNPILPVLLISSKDSLFSFVFHEMIKGGLPYLDLLRSIGVEFMPV